MTPEQVAEWLAAAYPVERSYTLPASQVMEYMYERAIRSQYLRQHLDARLRDDDPRAEVFRLLGLERRDPDELVVGCGGYRPRGHVQQLILDAQERDDDFRAAIRTSSHR